MPRENFEAEERSALLPAPTEIYDVPLWSDPKATRDQHAQVAKALYSLPTRYVVPAEKTAYALRDIEYLARQAESTAHPWGRSRGRFWPDRSHGSRCGGSTHSWAWFGSSARAVSRRRAGGRRPRR